MECFSAEMAARENSFRGMDKLTVKPLRMTLQIVRSDSSAAGGVDDCVFSFFPYLCKSHRAFSSSKATANS